MAKLEGKVALITGGARGIGKTIAEYYHREGAKIALCDVDVDSARVTADELSGGDGSVRAYSMNVADEAQVAVTIGTVMKDFGAIDILVNNAGITRDKIVMRMKKEDWHAVIEVNLTGTFFVSKAVVRGMMKARSGRIINIASVVGVVGNPGQANYSASKAGIIGLTKTMAKEFALRNINVNAIAPGYIATEMTVHLSEDAKKAFLASVPLNRPGSPEDVAKTALFLASDDASYITGQVVCVDGGMVM